MYIYFQESFRDFILEYLTINRFLQKAIVISFKLLSHNIDLLSKTLSVRASAQRQYS